MIDAEEPRAASHAEIQALVDQALGLWAAIRGIDLATVLADKRSYGMREYDAARAVSGMLEARGLDASGLTVFMRLRADADQFLRATSFTAHELVFQREETSAQIRQLCALYDLLEAPAVVLLIDAFTDRLWEEGKRLGYHDPAALTEALHNKRLLAHLRIDAIKALSTLRAEQFVRGVPEPAIGLSPHVYAFWNINSLLAAMRAQQVPGVTLVLLRDPESEFRSSFAFAVKNGERMTILTDKEHQVHPARAEMSRRPDRELEARADKYWFPYQWLQVAWDEDRLRVKSQDLWGIVPINTQAVQLGDLASMEPAQFIWTILVADQIRTQYGVEMRELPEQSYTAQMIVEPEALVARDSALVRAGAYTPLVLPPLTTDQVLAGSAEASAWNHAPTHFNSWMTDRYAARVPQSAYNLVGESSLLALPAHEKVDSRLDSWGRSTRLLRTLDPQAFGTPAQLARDRLWTARYNQMVHVQRLAEEEFKAEKGQVIAWYTAHVHAQRDRLLDAAAAGTLLLPVHEALGAGPFDAWKAWDVRAPATGQRESLIRRIDDWPQYTSLSAREENGDVKFYRYRSYPRFQWTCIETGKEAGLFAVITPRCPQALAMLAGCTVSDLPWPLQHWHKDEPYHGNSILDRLDPEDWVLKNPWRSLTLQVYVALSRTVAQQRRKKQGLEKLDFAALVAAQKEKSG